MKQFAALLLVMALLLGCCACGAQSGNQTPAAETIQFTDDAGRNVELPTQITRIAASGPNAQMILMTLCPELLVGLASTPSDEQKPYFPESMWELPTFGQFYGSKANLNMEALIDAKPQLVIDLGDRKDSIAEDMDMVQEQTGIPTIFREATLETLPAAYRTLGKLLDRQEQAEKLAQYVEKTLSMAEENRAKIAEADSLRVMYGTGPTGLACNAKGSVQADVIELIGAQNAIVSEEVSNRGGGTSVNLEEVYAVDPDVILLTADGPYDTLPDGEWAELTAVQNSRYYEIPELPYNWMSSPPSVNRVLGVWWLGNLLYPELYDYDMVQTAQEFYSLFWHYELSQAEAEQMLARSTLRPAP